MGRSVDSGSLAKRNQTSCSTRETRYFVHSTKFCYWGSYMNPLFHTCNLRCFEMEDFSYLDARSRYTNYKNGKFNLRATPTFQVTGVILTKPNSCDRHKEIYSCLHSYRLKPQLGDVFAISVSAEKYFSCAKTEA